LTRSSNTDYPPIAVNLSQAATLLLWSRDDVKTAIRDGIIPPCADEPLRLAAEPLGNDFDITDEELQAFVGVFEAAEPGRHPPVAIRRQLFIEARELCCICGQDGPFEFHHIIEWARLKHYDPNQMMLLCRNCHGKCTAGQIDVARQRAYKAQPHWKGVFTPPLVGNPITWDDLRTVVTELHSHLHPTADVDLRHDYQYADIANKNELNRFSPDYFATWQATYEPKLMIVKDFLGDERNDDVRELYYDIVGDLRSNIAAIQGKTPSIAFDDVLKSVFDAAFTAFSGGPRVNREALRTVIAFMYFECDIGRKE
jgi:hypothetical protein